MKPFAVLLVTLGIALSATTARCAPKNNEANALAVRGTEAAKNRQWDEAIEDLRKASNMDRKYAPSLVAALLGRAATYASQQQFKEAATDYDEALKFDSDNITALEGRASMAMKMNDMDKAVAVYTEAIKAHPKEIRYLQYRAYIYEVKGDLKNSMADNDKILHLEKDNQDALARKTRLEKRIANGDQGTQAQASPQGAPQATP
jgi:tetratricopeptide (TPR) repeat protein